MNKVRMLLRENQDPKVIYGILIVEGEGVTAEKVQDKIYEIKNSFADPDSFDDDEEIPDDVVISDEYTIEDVLERFPEEWNWSFGDYENVEI